MATKHRQNKSSVSSAKTNALQGIMGVNDVRDYLQARLNPAVAASLDAKLRLIWPTPSASLPPPNLASQELSSTDFDLESDTEANDELAFELRQGQLVWLNPEPQDLEPDHDRATFWFRDAQDVCHVLSGSDNAYQDFMQRFMATELRSDGYLPWAFTLLSLFRGGPSLDTPH